jgi:hypothetical protein
LKWFCGNKTTTTTRQHADTITFEAQQVIVDGNRPLAALTGMIARRGAGCDSVGGGLTVTRRNNNPRQQRCCASSSSTSTFKTLQYVLIGLAICVVFLQVRVFFHATHLHDLVETSSTSSSSSTTTSSTSSGTAVKKIRPMDGVETKVSIDLLADVKSHFDKNRNNLEEQAAVVANPDVKIPMEGSSSSIPLYRQHRHQGRPKVLIGIMSGTHNSMQRTYRNRHRQLFQLWNDTRLCSVGEYIKSVSKSSVMETNMDDNNNNNNSDCDCEVLYTFVVAAHNTETEPKQTSSSSSKMSTKSNHIIPTVIVDENTIDAHSFECSTVEESKVIKFSSVAHSWPLTLPQMPTYMAHYNDVIANPNDVTILNIKENMNDGKTPTFLYWAHQMAVRYDIPYVAKCDSDSVMRWPSLLNFIDKHLPLKTTSQDTSSSSTRTSLPYAVLGFVRSKATWDQHADENFWQQHFKSGLHLYLGGSFFLMSSDLAGGAAAEVRDHLIDHYRLQAKEMCRSASTSLLSTINQTPFTFKNVSYFEGHEDHDALSAAQVAATKQRRAIRWILPLKMQFSWEHPVKGMSRWNRIWNRELKRRDATEEVARTMFYWSDEAVQTPLPESASILVVLGAITKEMRQQFRTDLDNQKSDGSQICRLSLTKHKVLDPERCELYYFFALGRTDDNLDFDSLPNKIIDNAEKKIVDEEAMNASDEYDVLLLRIKQNVHSGIGESVLNWLQVSNQLSSDQQIRTDIILFCQVSYRFDVSKWKTFKSDHDNFLSPTTISPPHSSIMTNPFLIVGDIRERRQRPLEFPRPLFQNRTIHSSLFSRNLENIHLFTGSDCFGISSNLVPYILEQVRNPVEDDGVFFVENIGHDVTSYAYLASEQHSTIVVLQWVPVSTQLQFWGDFQSSGPKVDSSASKRQSDPTSVLLQNVDTARTTSLDMFSCSYGKGENLTTVQFPQAVKPPSFIMIGVQKSGTTSILSYLRDYHPNVLQTTKSLRREAHFFDTAWQGILKRCANMGLVQAKEKLCVALGDYMKLFDLQKLTEAAQDPNVTNHLYTFEKTPSYFCNPKIPPRIKQLVPWSKVILILRNPVDRLYSHYKMTVKDVFSLRSKTLEEFLYHEVQAMREFQMTTAPLPSRDKNITDHPEIHQDHPLPEERWRPKMAINSYTQDPELGHQVLLRRGLYSVQLKWWLKHFTLNEDILVINYNDMLEDTKSVLYRILDFAGIPIITSGNSSETYTKVRADNRKSERPMSDATRRYLQQFYAPYNAELETLLGHEWSTDRLGW